MQGPASNYLETKHTVKLEQRATKGHKKANNDVQMIGKGLIVSKKKSCNMESWLSLLALYLILKHYMGWELQKEPAWWELHLSFLRKMRIQRTKKIQSLSDWGPVCKGCWLEVKICQPNSKNKKSKKQWYEKWFKLFLFNHFRKSQSVYMSSLCLRIYTQ